MTHVPCLGLLPTCFAGAHSLLCVFRASAEAGNSLSSQQSGGVAYVLNFSRNGVRSFFLDLQKLRKGNRAAVSELLQAHALFVLHRVVGLNFLHVLHRAAMLPEAWHRRLPTGSHPATLGRPPLLWGCTHRGIHPRTCLVPVSTEVTFVLSLVAMGLTTSCVMVGNWGCFRRASWLSRTNEWVPWEVMCRRI